MRKSTLYTLFSISLVILMFSGCGPDPKLSLDVVSKLTNLSEKGGMALEVFDPKTGSRFFIEARRLASGEKPNPVYTPYSCLICPCPFPHCAIPGKPCPTCQ